MDCQCPACEERTWPKDRQKRQCLVMQVATGWFAQPKVDFYWYKAKSNPLSKPSMKQTSTDKHPRLLTRSCV